MSVTEGVASIAWGGDLVTPCTVQMPHRKWCLVLVAAANPGLREGLAERHEDNYRGWKTSENSLRELRLFSHEKKKKKKNEQERAAEGAI